MSDSNAPRRAARATPRAQRPSDRAPLATPAGIYLSTLTLRTRTAHADEAGLRRLFSIADHTGRGGQAPPREPLNPRQFFFANQNDKSIAPEALRRRHTRLLKHARPQALKS